MEIVEREFEYLIKLKDGRLVESRGTDWQDAVKRAGLQEAEIKRALPTKLIPTEAEKEAARKRLQELRANAKARESE